MNGDYYVQGIHKGIMITKSLKNYLISKDYKSQKE